MLAKINGDLRCYVSSAKANLQGQNCELKALLREASSNSSDLEAMLEQGQEKTANLEAELKCSKDEVNRIKSELQNSKGLLDAANKRLRDNGDYIEGLLEGRNSIVLKFTHETSVLKGDNAKLHARLLEEKEKRELVPLNEVGMTPSHRNSPRRCMRVHLIEPESSWRGSVISSIECGL